MPQTLEVLAPADWLSRAAAHEQRARAFGEPFVARRMKGRKHPIEDFLFTYYTQKPGQLYRWHPGMDVVLSGPEAAQRESWKFYRPVDTAAGPGWALDAEAFGQARAEAIRFARIILAGTAQRPGNFACFGLHEWAMVYRLGADQPRHTQVPLRLGPAGTDAVVESHRITCTHYDAYRFFAPDAAPRNTLRPTLDARVANEQPGCLHAQMDVYKWAHKLAPFTPAELVADCFELAREIRVLDMRASPYDLSEWGYSPVAIETASGKADYVAAQRSFARRASGLRQRIVRVCDAVLDGC